MKHDLLLHQRSEEQIDSFLSHPSHALLLTGLTGSGKPTTARAIASSLLQLEPERIENYPYYLHLQVPQDKQEIPIESIRDLINKLKLKTPGIAPIRRVVLVEDAQAMSQESQNAILKTLEEPSPETVFILTSPSTKNVLPTISSRAQAINIIPVTSPAAQSYYEKDFKDSEIAANWQLSAGSVGLLDALLKNSTNHPLKSAVNDFKDFLSTDAYGRLLDSERLGKDKLQLAYFLDAGARVLRALQHGSNNSAQRLKKITAARKMIIAMRQELESNANPRLIAISLALNLKL